MSVIVRLCWVSYKSKYLSPKTTHWVDQAQCIILLVVKHTLSPKELYSINFITEGSFPAQGGSRHGPCPDPPCAAPSPSLLPLACS